MIYGIASKEKALFPIFKNAPENSYHIGDGKKIWFEIGLGPASPLTISWRHSNPIVCIIDSRSWVRNFIFNSNNLEIFSNIEKFYEIIKNQENNIDFLIEVKKNVGKMSTQKQAALAHALILMTNGKLKSVGKQFQNSLSVIEKYKSKTALIPNRIRMLPPIISKDITSSIISAGKKHISISEKVHFHFNLKIQNMENVLKSLSSKGFSWSYSTEIQEENSIHFGDLFLVRNF